LGSESQSRLLLSPLLLWKSFPETDCFHMLACVTMANLLAGERCFQLDSQMVHQT
jgi:hypothetical protein